MSKCPKCNAEISEAGWCECLACPDCCHTYEQGHAFACPRRPHNVQAAYTPPADDNAERIAADAKSDTARPTTWVIERRIKALIERSRTRHEIAEMLKAEPTTPSDTAPPAVSKISWDAEYVPPADDTVEAIARDATNDYDPLKWVIFRRIEAMLERQRAGILSAEPASPTPARHKSPSTKRRWGLLPWRAAGIVVDVLTDAAKRYDDESWRQVPNGREAYFDAALRHLTAWHNGERLDQSGLPHLAHAACNVLFLVEIDEQ